MKAIYKLIPEFVEYEIRRYEELVNKGVRMKVEKPVVKNDVMIFDVQLACTTGFIENRCEDKFGVKPELIELV